MSIILAWRSINGAKKIFDLPQVKDVMEKEAGQGSIDYKIESVEDA